MHVGILSKSRNTIEYLRDELADHQCTVIRDRAQLETVIGRLDVLVTSSMGFHLHYIDKEILRRAGTLKLIQQFGVASDVVDVACAARLGIPVANIPGLNTVAVAELGIYLMFALAKRAPLARRVLAEGRVGEPVCSELAGKTLGVVGLGRIGTAVALRARGLGMRVIAVTGEPVPGAAKALGIDWVREPDELPVLLAESDYVMLALPLTPRTEGLIGEKELGRMKKGAYLINISRGPLVDREALTAALESGKLGGFAADALWEEPADPADPLLARPDVVVTPHIGATTEEVLRATAVAVRENIERLMLGEKPRYIVNRLNSV
ncbi:MAG: 2-hydroxyacid dehydrogenase [Thermoanaerobacterales bacterium]|nr:2-hydroxyacid dehydrogenase [Thermoanaerobacterales bacterium]